ncbi:MAG: hypothetical protein A3B86_02260 [Candidatus Yanofskybacteria bacterium RIFCSPHIGHO2_02_FULL_38_22b]|uniref:Resolvase/invertase-type recombinase catalytic domain-containing protein n=1 Tax=Candidatus Yanofskybacteria bacterium RIFCSPHIGHO2_02_FULL_38_22b TaxID=1802673 RepID=A0A1F8F4W3_9BACT|nr:MAG: hypothetical protein A3B86_02260 [Candidatus Yanofskybacteria bacterium RIFCSPHIGHO2_02_FULL_38_22b]OGN20272.1 MAG: hypothetical protein A2910_03095 [Candidatus Yanofskybacteria bacterium RIFCSPLOWO2_01_FULL_39_28]
MNKKNAIGYCRVSTDEQAKHGLSLDVQEESCKMAIQSDGYELLKIIRDEGKSGGNLNRAGMRELISLVINKKIDAIYTISGDRLNRNTLEYMQLRKLLRENDIDLKYINQANTDDSAMGRTMDTVLASFNEFQRLQTSEKVKKVSAARVEAGYFPTGAPIGYKNDINPDPNADRLAKKVIVPDAMAPLVTEAFKFFATGNFNGYDLCNLLNQKGLRTRYGKPMLPSRFYELLKNRIYLGEVHHGKNHNPNGKHKPLIDKATFDRVQSILDGHNKHACRRRKYCWLLGGFVYCARHGKRYTAEWHLNKKLAYYHCTNRNGCGKYIETNKLEALIADKFKDLEFNPEFIDKIIEKAKTAFYASRDEYDAKRQALVNQKTAFEAKLKSAEDKLFSEILLSDDYKRIRYEVKTEIESIEEQLAHLSQRQEVKVDIAKEILSFTKNIYLTYKKAPPHIKRHYLSLFWDRFEIQDGVIIKSVSSILFNHLLDLEQIYLKNQNPQITGDSDVLINIATELRGQDSNLEPSPYT